MYNSNNAIPHMTDDIVTQLRDDPVFVDDELLRQAADKIERLRAEIVSVRAERDCAQIQADHLSQRLINEARRG